jgi:hypothetical protein
MPHAGALRSTTPKLMVYGLGFMVWGLWFGVYGLGLQSSKFAALNPDE